MNKGVSNKNGIVSSNESYAKSAFTLTFVIEILGLDIWHDCNEGWLDLGTCYQGIKIQYQLYPGQSYDVDVLIWPHVVKIWCGMQYGWVRTWQFLERRWFAFTIRHAFPVRVTDFQNFVATVTPTFGFGALSANAKNDKNVEVYLPELKFGERRYFGDVIEKEESVDAFIQHIIWSSVNEFIPQSYLDGVFDCPQTVSDIRHQDAAISKVQETILSRIMSEEEIEPEPEEAFKSRDRRESKFPKDKKKILEAPKLKFEINLSGDVILAGVGRITQFNTIGDRPAELGEMIVLISSNNLPASDDLPIIFVNVETLSDIPVEELKKARISQLYTRWKIAHEVHDSDVQQIKTKKQINFNDRHAIPLEHCIAPHVTSSFLDNPFEIELRGILQASNSSDNIKFFNQGTVSKMPINDIHDASIAITKIDASALSKGINRLVRGEFSLFPLDRRVINLEREGICTNDINGIRKPLKPDIIVQPSIILQAQMTLEVSIGFVGCRPKELCLSLSRLYCFVDDSNTVIAVLRKITEINDEILASSEMDNLLTGFVLDTGDKVIFYVEGRRHGPILQIWHMAEDFYSTMKTLFSSSYTYATRLYPNMLLSPMPFTILKMYAPLSILLACPPVYVHPTLPLPARSALLKFGRLLANKLRSTPCRNEMPSPDELSSFRCELCSPPRPGCAFRDDINLVPNASQSRSAILENIFKKGPSKNCEK
ncbi:uncharacterized protein LOC119834068 [Zerene cesonia]|uniref:uncharacterized protein LOC119834068 n=1 Tax=Zerene cesonia TaxID=33412 RepID=UPI0018E5679E|nr:uncharacterized protein LOC119834068 [Zerene cesonia]